MALKLNRATLRTSILLCFFSFLLYILIWTILDESLLNHFKDPFHWYRGIITGFYWPIIVHLFIVCTTLTLIAVFACNASMPLYNRNNSNSIAVVFSQQVIVLVTISLFSILLTHIEGILIPHEQLGLTKYNTLVLIIVSFTCENIHFATQYNQLKVNEKVLSSNAKALEAEAIRLRTSEEVSRLSRQVDNHFMMNNLAVLDLLIAENDKRASDFCKAMTDFYRQIISFQGKQFISMEEECSFTGAFVSMMQIRYPESIFFDIHINSMESFIPPLALQGLIGNALKHNYFSADKPLKISVTEKDGLLTIKNSTSPTVSKQPSTHKGLSLLKEQYQNLNKEVVVNSNSESFSVVLPILHSIS